MAQPHQRRAAVRLPGPAEAPFWREVEEAFSAVLEAGEAARTAALAAHCGEGGAVRDEVEALLAAHTRAGEFITPATAGPFAAGDADEPAVPSRIGCFRLLERIGEGGMGAVYRAERVEGDFSQQVAVKLIAARMYGADTLRRFRAERQILATLQHPHIVALLDGGVTASGHPYIAMEYIEGLPITEYCRRRRLSLPARLALFRQLCGAVGFAHRHLVVHRDLKPANVLVTAEGMVKVLDFGVAKLLGTSAPAAEATGALLGPLTPDFASPEQLQGGPVTTASDVYGLGVMLYELLAGERPYRTAGRPMDELIAVVLQREPPRPSAAAGDAVPYDARRLRGDLDAIVGKAMAKDPDRRYPSAEELAVDVQRHLDGQPVGACPPSLRYLLAKTVARHRTAFAVAAVLCGLLVAALGAALWQARVAARERERALRRFSEVRQLTGAMIFDLHDEIAPLAGSTAARRTVIARGLRFLEALQRDADNDPALRVELARAYMRISNVLGNNSDANLGDRAGARDAARRARDLLQPLAAASGTPAAATVAWIDAWLLLAFVEEGPERMCAARVALAAAKGWHELARDAAAEELVARAEFQVAFLSPPAEALPHWQAADAHFRAVLATSPADLKRRRNLALTQKYLGGYFHGAGDVEAALPFYRRAYELDSACLRASPDDRRIQLDVAIDLGNIAGVHLDAKRPLQAIAGYRESLAIRRRLSQADPRDVHTRARTAYVHAALAKAYLAAGRLGPAREEIGRSLAQYADVGSAGERALAFTTLGDIEAAARRPEPACAAYRRAQRLFSDASRQGERGRTLHRAWVESMLARCAG